MKTIRTHVAICAMFANTSQELRLLRKRFPLGEEFKTGKSIGITFLCFPTHTTTDAEQEALSKDYGRHVFCGAFAPIEKVSMDLKKAFNLMTISLADT